MKYFILAVNVVSARPFPKMGESAFQTIGELLAVAIEDGKLSITDRDRRER